MKIGLGSCPSTCGELVQGYMGENECISSYCIDLYSNAKIVEKRNRKKSNRFNKTKSMKAVELVFDYFGIPKLELLDISLFIKSNIPVGKGMASSTADIGASVMAALDYLDKDLSEDEISKLVAKIEPTDSIFYKKICVFDPIKGKKIEELGALPYDEVLILEPYRRINTVKIRQKSDYYTNLIENKSFTTNSFNLLAEGIRNKDIKKVRRACENSALANEKIKTTPYLREIIKISKKYNAGFVNISHTGTVVGILVSDKTNKDGMIDEIRNSDISKIYKKQYIRKVVEGGLRKGWQNDGLHKKSDENRRKEF